MEALALSRAPRLPESRRLLALAGDDRLVALVRAGSEAAFETIYERYHRPLLSFCRHLVGNRDDAAEAVQHTFLAAYRDVVETEKPIHLRPWLFTIARNRSMSLLRARREHADVDAVQPSTDGLASEVQRREDLRELLHDLTHLPVDQRAALVLAEIGSLSHAEIAQVIDCPEKKVKALVFQARSSLAARRDARDLPCQEVREQLATQTSGALRRGPLRRHVSECPGCREFRDEVRRQRSAFAAILPVAPVAGLKESVISALGGGAGGTAAAGGVAGTGTAGAGGVTVAMGAVGASGLVVKAIIAAAIIGGIAAGGVAIGDRGGGAREADHVKAARDARSAGGSPTRSAVLASAAVVDAGSLPDASSQRTARRHAKPHVARGNSAAAHRNALSHGRGRKRGLLGTQPGRSIPPTRGRGNVAGSRPETSPGNRHGAPVVTGRAGPHTNPRTPGTVAPSGRARARGPLPAS